MEIVPVKMTQSIPNFEIGTYTDIVNPDNNPHETNDDFIDDEEIEPLIIYPNGGKNLVEPEAPTTSPLRKHVQKSLMMIQNNSQ